MYNGVVDIDKLKMIKLHLDKNDTNYHSKINLLNDIIHAIKSNNDPLEFIDNLRKEFRRGTRSGLSPFIPETLEVREQLSYLNRLFPENDIDINNEIISQRHGSIPKQVIYLRKKAKPKCSCKKK
jgi:hypothetical protein